MAIPSISGIYRIRNLLDGKVYIGSSVTVHKRWNKHRSELSRGVHGCRYLQCAWDKYGQVAFVFEFLEEVSSRRKEDLILREQYWLDLTRAHEEAYGYNIKIKADSCSGVTRSAETRQKMSIAKKGIKPSAEALAKLSKALKGRISPNKGKTFSAEARANMSAAQKKKWSDPTLRERQAERYRGRTLSEEHKRNVSTALKDRVCSPSTRQKISAAHKGKPKSDAHRQAVSAGLRTWWADQEIGTPNTCCHGCGKSFFAFLPTRAKWCSQSCRNKANKPKAESQGFLGRHHSEETKRRISEAKLGTPSWNKGIPMTAIAKEKMRAKKIGINVANRKANASCSQTSVVTNSD